MKQALVLQMWLLASFPHTTERSTRRIILAILRPNNILPRLFSMGFSPRAVRISGLNWPTLSLRLRPKRSSKPSKGIKEFKLIQVGVIYVIQIPDEATAFHWTLHHPTVFGGDWAWSRAVYCTQVSCCPSPWNYLKSWKDTFSNFIVLNRIPLAVSSLLDRGIAKQALLIRLLRCYLRTAMGCKCRIA